MKPTTEQSAAIQTQGRAVVVDAGAGTGKTWVLVNRFIHLLETHPDWPLESIFAITFTEKAAREMRTRIRKAIELKAFKLPDQERWQEHRLNLDRMQVSTIHSLCARILRENSIAAGIDPRFQVLDEQEGGLLKDEAIRKTIQTLDEKAHPALELLTSLRIYDLRNVLAGLLQKRGTLYRLFHNLEDSAGLLRKWQEGFEEMRVAIWEGQLRENADLLTILEALPQKQSMDPQDALTDAVRFAQEGCDAYHRGDLVGALNVWLKIGLRGGKQDNWGGKEKLLALKEDLKTPRSAAQKLENTGALQQLDELDQAAAEHLQLWLSLWNILEEVYSDIKNLQQALDFDDLELLTERLFQSQPYGGRLQGFLDGINHLMVDEFQDTNPVQQRIVYALAPPDEGGKLFVVGDAKQSIYRFRQAEVSIFNQTAREVESYTGHPVITLRTSFRSHNSLVKALNDLFNVILLPGGTEKEDYEAAPGPLITSRETPPMLKTPVELLLLPKDEPGGEGTLTMEDARIWEAGWIGQRIISLKENQFSVWDKNQADYRPFEFKDAAVLFRATTSVTLYEAVFKDLGLPYLTVSGRGYYDRPEVQDLITLLSALANPADDLNLAAALRSPLFSLSDETLYRLRWHQASQALEKKMGDPIPYRVALLNPPPTDQSNLVERAHMIMEELWQQVDRVAIWELLRKALDATAYETSMTLSDGLVGRKLSNVHKFMTLVRERGEVNVAEFLRQLRDLQIREAREGEALGREPESGAVQLMSIHAAKGLEFPVVVLADLGRKSRGSFGSPYLLHDPNFGIVCKVRDPSGDWVAPVGYAWGKWMNEAMEEAENKRLLYVAATRAADFLILSGRTGSRDSWMTEILQAWSIDEVGLAEEIISYEDYDIKVHRPEIPVEVEKVSEQVKLPSSLAFREMPSLALPLPEILERKPLAVTTWAAILENKVFDRDRLRPASWGPETHNKQDFVPRKLLGEVVHEVLAQWTPLADPEDKLISHLMMVSRQKGSSESQLPQTVRSAMRILTRLKTHPLYEHVNQAKRRFHEIPFTLSIPDGMLHGVIDLLYLNDEEWHLVDWKTDWVTQMNLEVVATRYKVQVGYYFDAVEKLFGILPKTWLVFLEPKVSPYRIEVIHR